MYSRGDYERTTPSGDRAGTASYFRSHPNAETAPLGRTTMIREFGETIGDTVVESLGRAFARTQEHRPLSTDVLESEEAYLVLFDAPGVERGDVQVRFEDRTIHVRVDRFREFHEDFEMRFPGRGLSMKGTVRLPGEDRVDPGEATATLEDEGLLRVRIPKEAEPEHEETESGGENGTDGDADAGTEHEDISATETGEEELDAPESQGGEQ